MADIRSYIQSHILAPLKQYPTIIQDTMLEVITSKLEELYELSWMFPNIITPNTSRLDILEAIAQQFLFTIRRDADLQEQINILNNILYVYNRRGSVDTIENMWKYYGGELPKDVKVVIPSYNLFRYSMSALSGTHTFVKGKSSYITLDTPSPVEIPSGGLVRVEGTPREILITGVVRQGSRIVNLANAVGLNVGDTVIVDRKYTGRIVEVYSSSEVDRTVNTSGAYEIRLTNNTYPIADLREFLLKELVAAGNEIYFTNDLHLYILGENPETNPYKYNVSSDYLVDIYLGKLYCTTSNEHLYISRDLYNDQGELIESRYPGYFILGETPLNSLHHSSKIELLAAIVDGVLSVRSVGPAAGSAVVSDDILCVKGNCDSVRINNDILCAEW